MLTNGSPKQTTPKDKLLEEMSLEELWQLFPIELAEYSQEYPTWYAEEKRRLLALFGNSLVRINHIGSTAVSGLLAKPIIDILLEIGEELTADEIIDRLATDAWLLMADTRKPLRLDLNKGYTPQGFADKVYHLHAVRPGDHPELYFRDWLREHMDTQEEYAALKRQLALRYRNNRDGYTEAKTAFVQSITEKARAAYSSRYEA